MNTKIYKRVHALAIALLTAADEENDSKFGQLYNELTAICEDNEQDSDKNHPVQWETLADFSEDSQQALQLYKKALGYAQDIAANDYIASINYAMALMISEEVQAVTDEEPEDAFTLTKRADEAAQKTDDIELQREIKTLLKRLIKNKA
ncbi:MAG: hypothetical protein ACJAYG_001403 [Oceanicoccus sp.]|jgi:hypothetical protein